MTQFDKLDRGPWGSARREAAARTGVAMPNGDYPCEDREDVRRAVATAHQHPDPDAARNHITGRAQSLECADELPSHWPGSTRPADAPQVGAAPGHPFLEQAAKIRHRLDLAKGFLPQASVAKPELLPQIEADTRKLAGDLGFDLAVRRSQRAPRSFLKIGAAN
jgi:hypothetical protein